MALYNELRPGRWDDMIGQDAVRKVLSNQCATHNLAHAYVLCGTRGCGKTTSARLIAKAANCSHVDANGNPCGTCESCRAIDAGTHPNVREVDAARNRGVDYADRLIEDTMYAPVAGKKVYIIDEAHMLSKEAVNALLKVMEEAPEYVIFILCTTDLNALPKTIRSRAQVFTYARVDVTEIANYIGLYLTEHEIAYENEAICAIAQNADGGVRDALSILERCMSMPLTAANVRKILGRTSEAVLEQLIALVMARDVSGVFSLMNELEGDIVPATFIAELQALLSEYLVVYSAKSEEHEAEVEDYAQFMHVLTDIAKQVRTAPFPHLCLRTRLVEYVSVVARTESLRSRLEKLEQESAFWRSKIEELMARGFSIPSEPKEEKEDPAPAPKVVTKPAAELPKGFSSAEDDDTVPFIENPIKEVRKGTAGKEESTETTENEEVALSSLLGSFDSLPEPEEPETVQEEGTEATEAGMPSKSQSVGHACASAAGETAPAAGAGGARSGGWVF